LGLPKPKPTPYNLRMVNKTTYKVSGIDSWSEDICL
jgi:hypothetical protein